MSEEDELALFNQSFGYCHNNPRFLDRFYELLMSSSDAVAVMFARTDSRRHKIMLNLSFYTIMNFARWGDLTYPDLDCIGKIHSGTGKDIPAELYTLWMESLIQTVRECAPNVDPRIEVAWRRVLRRGIPYVTARY